MHFMVAKALESGRLTQSEKRLNSPAIQAGFHEVYFGSARGIYRGFEVSLFRGTSFTHGDTATPKHFAHAVLLFKDNLGIGRCIKPKQSWSVLMQALPFGSHLKFDNAPGLNRKLVIKPRINPGQKQFLPGLPFKTG